MCRSTAQARYSLPHENQHIPGDRSRHDPLPPRSGRRQRPFGRVRRADVRAGRSRRRRAGGHAGQSGAHPDGPADRTFRPPSPGGRPLARREAGRHRREDQRDHRHRSRLRCRDPARPASGGGECPARRHRTEPAARQEGDREFYRSPFRSRRPATLHERRSRIGESVRRGRRCRRPIPRDPAATDRRRPAERRDPRRTGPFCRWPSPLRLRQSFQPTPRDRYSLRRAAAIDRRRRGALRRRPGRREGVRQQLGRASSRSRRPCRPGRQGDDGSGRSCSACGQRGEREHRRSRLRGCHRGCCRSACVGFGRQPRWAACRVCQRRGRHRLDPRRDERHGRGDGVDEVDSGGIVRGPAGRACFLSRRRAVVCLQRGPERRRGDRMGSGRQG